MFRYPKLLKLSLFNGYDEFSKFSEKDSNVVAGAYYFIDTSEANPSDDS